MAAMTSSILSQEFTSGGTPFIKGIAMKDNFCHQRDSIHWLCPDPERYVNRFHSPNLMPDFEKQANIAIRDIKKVKSYLLLTLL